MKFFNKSLLAAAVLGTSLASQSAMAEQKIGVVNVQGIMQSLPQYAAIQETINSEFKDQIEEVQRLKKDIDYYMEKLQRDAATMSESEKKDLQDKIIAAQTDYQEKGRPLQQNIQRRTSEEQNKLMGLVKQSLDSIAAKGKFDIVLSAPAISYLADPEKYDLSSQVIEQVSKIK